MTILPNSSGLVGAPANLTWQQHMKLAIRDADELAFQLNLPAKLICRQPSLRRQAFSLEGRSAEGTQGRTSEPTYRRVLFRGVPLV